MEIHHKIIELLNYRNLKKFRIIELLKYGNTKCIMKIQEMEEIAAIQKIWYLITNLIHRFHI